MRIVDDALLPEEFKKLQDTVLDKHFPWFYARKAYDDDEEANPYLRGWMHSILPDNAYKSPLATTLDALVRSTFERLEEPVDQIWRMRAIMNTLAPTPYQTGIHSDYGRPHKTALIYLNDADGNTVIFDEKWTPDHPRDPAQLTIAHEIEPKANRIAFFDGLHLHTGAIPTMVNRRVVININYV